jgi:hypothetical protein
MDEADDGDTIDIGVGEFGPGITATRVFLRGVGAGDPLAPPDTTNATTIRGVDTLAVGGIAVVLNGGGGVQDIRMQAGQSGVGGINAPAFSLFLPTTTPLTVDLDGAVALGGTSTGGSSDGGPGIFLSAAPGRQITLRGQVHAAGGGGAGTRGSALDSTGAGVTLDLADSFFRGTGVGLSTTAPAALKMVGGRLELERSEVAGGQNGLMLLDTDATIERSRVRAIDLGILHQSQTRSTTLAIRDSLVSASTASPSGAINVSTPAGPLTTRATITASTAVLTSPDVDPAAIRASGEGSRVDLRNAIADGPQRDLNATDGATITATHSAFQNSVVDGGATAPSPGSDANVNAAPGFVDFPDDFALLPTSPLIDKGDPAFVTPGELDLVGNPRAQNGDGMCAAEPDIGAFELPSTAPAFVCEVAATNVAPALSKVSLLRKRFTVRKPRSKRRKRGTRIRFTLSEAAKVKLSFGLKSKGRKVGRKCAKPTRRNRKRKRCTRYVSKGSFSVNGKAGKNDVKFAGKVGRRLLKPGTYRLTLQATDPQGAKSARRTLTFKVLRP